MKLTVDGIEREVTYDHHAVDEVIVPKLEQWMAEASDGSGGVAPLHRRYAFLAAPPGAGKSILAELLADVLKPRLQCVAMDGFHLSQAELDARTYTADDGTAAPLSGIKGAPETFDVGRLASALEQGESTDIRWPSYDRGLHDVVPDGPRLTAGHVLLEGNWLLLDRPGWRELRRFASFTIFLSAPEPLLRTRLIERKVSGGLSVADAERFYDRSDGPNVRRVLTGSVVHDVDLSLTLDDRGFIHERDSK